MDDPYVIGGWIVGVANAAAAALGLLLWTLRRPGPVFWWPARLGQVAAAVFAVFAGGYAVAGHPPDEGLTWVYILTPIAVSYFAEQLRLLAAQQVLERFGHRSAGELRAAVEAGEVDGEEYTTGIAHEVLLREMGVVAIAAVVIAFLGWRVVITG